MGMAAIKFNDDIWLADVLYFQSLALLKCPTRLTLLGCMLACLTLVPVMVDGCPTIRPRGYRKYCFCNPGQGPRSGFFNARGGDRRARPAHPTPDDI